MTMGKDMKQMFKSKNLDAMRGVKPKEEVKETEMQQTKVKVVQAP